MNKGRPLKVPAGATPFVGETGGGGWCIRYAMPGEVHSEQCKRLSGTPIFNDLANAQAFIDEGSNFRYPPGAV